MARRCRAHCCFGERSDPLGAQDPAQSGRLFRSFLSQVARVPATPSVAFSGLRPALGLIETSHGFRIRDNTPGGLHSVYSTGDLKGVGIDHDDFIGLATG